MERVVWATGDVVRVAMSIEAMSGPKVKGVKKRMA